MTSYGLLQRLVVDLRKADNRNKKGYINLRDYKKEVNEAVERCVDHCPNLKDLFD